MAYSKIYFCVLFYIMCRYIINTATGCIQRDIAMYWCRTFYQKTMAALAGWDITKTTYSVTVHTSSLLVYYVLLFSVASLSEAMAAKVKARTLTCVYDIGVYMVMFGLHASYIQHVYLSKLSWIKCIKYSVYNILHMCFWSVFYYIYHKIECLDIKFCMWFWNYLLDFPQMFSSRAYRCFHKGIFCLLPIPGVYTFYTCLIRGPSGIICVWKPLKWARKGL